MPWTLTSLAEHEESFQHWCILQMSVGVLATLFIFLLSVSWSATTDDAMKMSFGSIILNTIMRLSMGVLATWIIWFGVIEKHGCCCAVACCCLGKPNILVVAIVEGVFALATLMFIFQALGFGHVLLILAALVAVVHLVTQVYLTIAAFMVWLKSHGASTAGGQEVKVGPPVTVGQGAVDSEKDGQEHHGSGGRASIQEKVEETDEVQEV